MTVTGIKAPAFSPAPGRGSADWPDAVFLPEAREPPGVLVKNADT